MERTESNKKARKMPTYLITLFFCFHVVICFSQSFKPTKPDTFYLRAQEAKLHYKESVGYLYLMHYYNSGASRDSVILDEWSTDYVCAFKQEFKQNILYQIDQCGEGKGLLEDFIFPRMELSTAKAFIEELFYDKWNTWISETMYGPDGAGCYYEILQKEEHTIIDTYCGC